MLFRAQTADFLKDVALDAEEDAARVELAITVAKWSNRIEGGIVADDWLGMVSRAACDERGHRSHCRPDPRDRLASKHRPPMGAWRF